MTDEERRLLLEMATLVSTLAWSEQYRRQGRDGWDGGFERESIQPFQDALLALNATIQKQEEDTNG